MFLNALGLLNGPMDVDDSVSTQMQRRVPGSTLQGLWLVHGLQLIFNSTLQELFVGLF